MCFQIAPSDWNGFTGDNAGVNLSAIASHSHSQSNLHDFGISGLDRTALNGEQVSDVTRLFCALIRRFPPSATAMKLLQLIRNIASGSENQRDIYAKAIRAHICLCHSDGSTDRCTCR